jgi:phosphate transport system permease protein
MRKLTNRLMTVLMALSAIICLIPLFLVIYHLLKMGFNSINLNFFIHNPKPMGELGGGMLNAIVGTLMTVGLASVFGIPIGLMGGIFLFEFKQNNFANIIRILVDLLSGIPSIIIGIVIYGWIVKPSGGFSAFAGSIALAIMMIPIIIRSTEEVLRLVPYTLREAAYSLGAPRWKTMFFVVVRTSIGGVISSVLSSIARVSGETAPLLFTAFGNEFFSIKMYRPMSSLPLQIFNYAKSPSLEQNRLAWAGSIVLVGIVFILYIIARWIGYKLTKRSTKH